MARARRRLLGLAAATLLAASGLGSAGGLVPSPAQAATTPFTDIAGSIFKADIEWLWAEGITTGCTATKYCPDDPVKRDQMASFLARMFKLPPTSEDFFSDDEGNIHEANINRLAAAGITTGCTDTTFCPKDPVRRDQMASFLTRAVPLTVGDGRNYFRDDDGSLHETAIDRAAAAGIASGCGTWRYCPSQSVMRGQMAAFLHRVVKPVTPPPYPAPATLTLHVATSGSDPGNDCLVEATPCRTIRYALSLALDGDTISIGPGTFSEENLQLGVDLTIRGDPAGGTTIDATGGSPYATLRIYPSATVALEHLTLSGGQAKLGGAIYNEGDLTITHSTLSGNTANEGSGGDSGGAIYNHYGILTITDSTISGNSARSGGGIYSTYGTVTVTDSIISGNTNPGGYGSGGGIKGYYATLTVIGSTISGNTAGRGGGINLSDGTLTLANSTVSGNAAITQGGGLSSYPGTVTVTNSTISGNTAKWAGGGLWIYGGSSLHLANGIVAGNTSPDGPDVYGPTSQLASIVGVPVGLTLADILDPAGLKDNGGPTQTIALTDSTKNPALDTGDAATCAGSPVNGLDQRGEPRDPPCDIGAYELQP